MFSTGKPNAVNALISPEKPTEFTDFAHKPAGRVIAKKSSFPSSSMRQVRRKSEGDRADTKRNYGGPQNRIPRAKTRRRTATSASKPVSQTSRDTQEPFWRLCDKTQNGIEIHPKTTLKATSRNMEG